MLTNYTDDALTYFCYIRIINDLYWDLQNFFYLAKTVVFYIC